MSSLRSTQKEDDLEVIKRKIESWDKEDITVLERLYTEFARVRRSDEYLLLSVPSAEIPMDLIDFSFVAVDRHGNCLMKSGEIKTVESLRQGLRTYDILIDHFFTAVGVFIIREQRDFWEVEEPAGHVSEHESRQDAESYIQRALRQVDDES